MSELLQEIIKSLIRDRAENCNKENVSKTNTKFFRSLETKQYQY